jgi:chloramphenicol 3-O phosphotransferase
MNFEDRPTIVLINGASSSGKSTLIKILQDKLERPFLNAGLDKFIWMLPYRYLNTALWSEYFEYSYTSGTDKRIKAIKVRRRGHQLVSGMHLAVAALLQSGNNVLVDHVFMDPNWVAECASLFHPYRVYLIGLHCPLAVLENREASRKDRTLGQARAQYHIIHRQLKYDLTIDTNKFSAEDAANQIISLMSSGIEPTAINSIHNFRIDKSNMNNSAE